MNTDRPIQVEPTGSPQGARLVSSRTARRSLASFTLIELLVVVAVILILLGISMKVLSIANSHAEKAKTLYVLEQVKNAIGAYYTQYGVYPPVDGVDYIYPKTLASTLPAPPKGGMGYVTGLVYYIYSGAYHNTDAEAATWQHYLVGLDSGGSITGSGWDASGTIKMDWTNATHTIPGIGYECKTFGSSCQRYRLWSGDIEVTSD